MEGQQESQGVEVDALKKEKSNYGGRSLLGEDSEQGLFEAEKIISGLEGGKKQSQNDGESIELLEHALN